MLEGAYRPILGKMSDELRQSNLLPLEEPYSKFSNITHTNSGERTTSAVLSNITSPTVVDWIFLELRDANNTANIVATRAALLRQDGTITDVDGSSAVRFTNVNSGNYYVVVRHRNHLGIRTLNTFSFGQNATVINFAASNTALYGTNPVINLAGTNFRGMISGDANFDGSIDSIDSAVWENENGTYDDYTANGDYNLDGSVDSIDSVVWELNNGTYEEID
jgi:hypothetical protein